MKLKITLISIQLLLAITVMAQPKNQLDKKGLKNGLWEVTYENSEAMRYTGSFVHGTPSGAFTYYFPNGVVKTNSTFSNEGLDNQAIIYYPSGRKMGEGNYTDQKKMGEWKFYDEAGVLRSVEFYLNGEKHGKSSTYNFEGMRIQEMEYLQDIEHGMVTDYFPNGNVMRTYTFEKGTKEGESVFYYLNGKIKNKGVYKYDTKDGWWTENLENGSTWKFERFELGKLKETNMINGEYITYFENGVPATIYNFKNGKKNGSFREYYNLGGWKIEGISNDEGQVVDKRRVLDGDKLKIAGKYMNDELQGSIQHFSKEGKLIKVETYQNGKLMNTKDVN